MNSLDEKIKNVQDNLKVRPFNAEYSFKQKTSAFIHGRKLPKKYYVRKDLNGDYDFEMIQLVLDTLIQYAHLGKGTSIVIGETDEVIKPNVSQRNNPWPEQRLFDKESLEEAIRLSLIHDKEKNDNLDGAIHIKNNYIVALGALIRADYYGMADELGIPNNRTCWERLPFSNLKGVGTRSLSAFAAPYFIEKEQEQKGVISDYKPVSIVLSSSGKIKVYSREGIIMSSDHSEIEKSALFANNIYAYNMSDEELKSYYASEVRKHFNPSYKSEFLPEIPLVPQEARQEEKVLVSIGA